MKITIYELLGKVKNDSKTDIYVKYFNKISQKEDKMWACKENIIYKLENLIIDLNDEVQVIEEVEEKEIEKLPRDRKGFSVTYHYWSNAQQDQLIDNFSNIYSMANNNRDKINELIDVVNELKNKD